MGEEVTGRVIVKVKTRGMRELGALSKRNVEEQRECDGNMRGG